jgi:RNA polymerase sigma-70 factor (ECF subfamily)
MAAVPPSDSAQQEQEVLLLHRALMRMPEDKREILILSRFQELKYEEIARLVGCELATVRVRVHRALQELRETFHQLEGRSTESKPAPSLAKNVPHRRVGSNEV